jgi:hypothetical protein
VEVAVNPHGVAALPRFERGALPVGPALRVGGEGDTRTPKLPRPLEGLAASAVGWTPRPSFPLRDLPSSSGWSPREDSNLHCRVRSPEVSCISLRGDLCVVTSRGIEPRSLGLRPSAMTTPARWSNGADGGNRTRACALRGRRASGNTSSTWSRLEGSDCERQRAEERRLRPAEGDAQPRSSGNRPEVLPVGRSLEELAVGPGLEPGSFRVTGGRVTVATTLQAMRVAARRGLEPRSATSEAAVLPLGRSGNGRVERTRTSTDLRPKQVGCQLPDPRAWGERPESNRLERGSQTRGAPFAFAHHRVGSR